MPTVPVYGQQRVQRTALPGARRSSSASTALSEGAGVGQAIAEVGTEATRLGAGVFGIIQERERQRADEIQNLKTLQAFNELDHKYLYDQQTGFLAKQGQDPHDQSAQYVSSYNADADAIAGGIKSERAKAYYEALKANRTDSFRNRVDQHATQEYDKFEGQQFNATMESSINAAIAAGANDLDTVKLQLGQQDEAIKLHGARLGMSPQAQELLRDKSHAAVHAGVVDNLIAQQKLGQASAYFDETKDVIAKGDPNAKERIERALSEGTTLAEAQRASDQVLAAFKNEADARDAIKIQVKDPKVRQQALELVEHEFNVREQQDQQAHKDLTLRGLNIVERTGNWTSIPANEWSQYTVGERESIKEYLRQKATGLAVKTDPVIWAAAIRGLSSSDPQERKFWQNANPVNFIDKLSPSDYQEFIRAQNSSVKGEESALTNQAQQTRIVDEALGFMGLPSNPVEPGKEKFDKPTYDRVSAFRRSVREAQGRLEQAKGKPATDSEVQSIVDQLRTKVGQKVTSAGRLYNTYGDAYAFEVAQAQASSINDVPPTEVRRLKQLLKDEGGDWSDAGVLKLFNLLLTQTRKDR